MRHRMDWWWAGVVDWFVGVPFALRSTARGALARARFQWWRLSEFVLDVLYDVRTAPGRAASRCRGLLPRLRRPVREVAPAHSAPVAVVARPIEIVHREPQIAEPELRFERSA